MSGQVKEVGEATFAQDVLQAATLVVVDFWAPWCGPCRYIGPIVEELAQEYQDRVAFLKLNTDENQALAMQYSIRSIPTLLFFKNGEEIGREIGAKPKAQLQEIIEANL